MRQYIGAVRAKNNILSPLRLFIMTSLINKAVASGNGNRFLTQKRHVHIANNSRPPQCHTEAELLSPSRPPLIFRYHLPLKGSHMMKDRQMIFLKIFTPHSLMRTYRYCVLYIHLGISPSRWTAPLSGAVCCPMLCMFVPDPFVQKKRCGPPSPSQQVGNTTH